MEYGRLSLTSHHLSRFLLISKSSFFIIRYAEFDRSVQSTMGIFSPSEKVKKKNDVTGDESSVEESDLNLYLTQEEITVSNDCNTIIMFSS